jgi:hypothetical protein
MKILITGTIDADFDNREEIFCEQLSTGLIKAGHEVDVCYLPFKRDMLNAAEQIFAYSLVDTMRADALVTVGYPACFVPHRNEKKVSYLFDCYPEIHEDFSFKLREHRVEERIKITEKILIAESRTFKGINKIFAATEELSRNINMRYGVDAEILSLNDKKLVERVESALS